MAKKRSEKVMEQRKRDYDQISFVMEKDARYLIRAQAIREGVTSAEVMRRAILARCGLDKMPDTTTQQYQDIKTVELHVEAEQALTRLQDDERDTEKETQQTYLVTLAGRVAQNEYIGGLLGLLDEIEDVLPPTKNRGWQGADKIIIDKRKISAIRRLLANMQEVESDDADDYDDTMMDIDDILGDLDDIETP